MKRFLLSLSILAGLFLVGSGVAYGSSVFNSSQVGSTPTNNYVLQTNGTVSTWVATSTLGISGGGGSSASSTLLSDNNTFSGVNQFTGATTTIANLGVSVDASAYAGADMGAKINAAYAALPSTGGEITVPAGYYPFSTPIVFATANKVVILKGAGISGNAAYAPSYNGGTILQYTGTTGIAVTVDTNYSSGGSMIEDLSIMGTNGTTARSTIGVQFGGGTGGFNGTLFYVGVSGFGVGVRYDTYTSFNIIDHSVINFNGRNIDEPSVGGANGENMRVVNSVIADSNNQAGGATDLYCIYITISGNIQWNFINDSIDDCQFYSNQYGGTANVNSFQNVHWENPNGHTYDYIKTLSARPALATQILGGDMMNDAVGGMPEFIYNGGSVSLDGTTFDVNNNVTTPVTRIITNQDSTNVDNVAWSGIKQRFDNTSAGAAVTYIYGTTPFPTIGATSGTGDATNQGPSLIATQFAGADIGAQVNAAYLAQASTSQTGGTIIIPEGKYSFSTPIVFGTAGQRVLLQGTPAGGTELDYTGTGAAITINTGIQGTGIDHTSGNGISGISLYGNSYSTSSPQIGVLVGGTNGTDGAVLDATNIYDFGYGLQIAANAYHFNYENGTIRANGQNVHINAASNSGESLDFTNAFIVDGYATYGANPIDCFWMDNSATASLNYTGGSLDDCQLHVLQANNVTFTGTHFENVGYSAWGPYDYIVADQNLATNISLNGTTFFNDAATTGNSPATYILNGGNITLNGIITREFGGQTVTDFVTNQGSGRVTWTGFNNVSNKAVTNVVGTGLVPVNGTTASTTIQGTFNVFQSAATSTVYLDGSLGGGVIMKDDASGGCTEIYTLAGVVAGKVVSCPF